MILEMDDSDVGVPSGEDSFKIGEKRVADKEMERGHYCTGRIFGTAGWIVAIQFGVHPKS